MKPDVSIVILSYCQAGLVKQLLKLLAEFQLPFAVETIVVDNASLLVKSIPPMSASVGGMHCSMETVY
jgi:hypothetical protein